MKFYEKLKKIRTEKGISQAALAQKAGVSKAVIGYWELNQRSPKIGQVMKIASALNVDWSSLLDDEILEYRPKTVLLRDDIQNLTDTFNKLNDDGKQMLMSYAQFLLNNPMYGSGTTSMKDASLYDGAKNQKALEDLTEKEKVALASHPSTKEKK